MHCQERGADPAGYKRFEKCRADFDPALARSDSGPASSAPSGLWPIMGRSQRSMNESEQQADDGEAPYEEGRASGADTPEATSGNPTVSLIRELQRASSESGWGTLSGKIDRFLKRVYNTRDVPSGTDFADFTQVVFGRLLTAMPSLQLRSRREFWGYVKRLADNAKLDLWRRARTEKNNFGQAPLQQVSPSGVDRLAETDRACDSPSAHARRAELEERELECVMRLANEESREVYLLRRREGKSYEEIAELVGRRKAATVKVIFHRAQKGVTNCLRSRLDGYTAFFGALG